MLEQYVAHMKKELRRQLEQDIYQSDEQIYELIDALILKEHAIPIPLAEKNRLRKELFYSVRKLDILQILLEDSSITEIMVNGPNHIFVERYGKIEKCGTPRCDIFFNDKAKEQIKRKILNQYNIDKEKKIILYAPTFRKNNEKENTINFEQLNEIIKNNLKIYLR